jgi:type I restriction enzyme R subunit
MASRPEDKAREDIDRKLERAGWDVQDIDHAEIYSRQGIAIRDFPLKQGHGFAIIFCTSMARPPGLSRQRRRELH